MRQPSEAIGSLEAAGPVVGERLLDFRLRVHDEGASKRDRLAQRLAGEKKKAAGIAPRLHGKFRRSRLLRSRQPAKLAGLQKVTGGPDLDRAFEDVDKGIVGRCKRVPKRTTFSTRTSSIVTG